MNITNEKQSRGEGCDIIWWIVLSMNILFSIAYPIFLIRLFNNETVLLYTTFHISKPFAYIAMVIFIVLQIHVLASCLFPQAIIIFSALC